MTYIGITTTLTLRATTTSDAAVSFTGDIRKQGDPEFSVTVDPEDDLLISWAATMSEIEKAVVDAFVLAAASVGYTVDKHNIYFAAPIT